MANLVTLLRIVLSVAILFFPALSVPFYVFYILAGITDMTDGIIARKTDTVSELGARIDTIADIIMVAVCFFKLFSVLNIEVWMYIWVAIIAVIKIINITMGFVIHKKFVTIHSVMNKVTGALLFILPLTFRIFSLRYSVIIVCTVATFAAVQEGYLIRKKV